MRIAVTGGTGTIGLAVIGALQSVRGADITSFSRTEARIAEARRRFPDVRYEIWDIRDMLFPEQHFEWVIHTAAMKHVPECEENPDICAAINIGGTRNALRLAPRSIVISTDKSVEPVGVMGASKMIAERMALKMGAIAVRLVNIMPSTGSVFGIWEQQFKAKEPLTITDPNMTRYFMTVMEAADLVLTAMRDGFPGDVFIPAAEPIRLGTLADRLAGKDYPRKILGLRPGERMDERLMFPGEEARAVPMAHCWVIRNATVWPKAQLDLEDQIEYALPMWRKHAG